MEKVLNFMFVFMLVSVLSLEAMSQEELNNQLLEAAEKGNFFEIEDALDEGANINASNAEGDNALLIFLENREDRDVVEYLIKKGIDINHQDPEGISALHITTINNMHEMSKILLSHNADVNLISKSGSTPLINALDQRYIDNEIVELLLMKGANPNVANKEGGAPLFYVIDVLSNSPRHRETIKLLLRYETDVNALSSKYGETALIHAIKLKAEIAMKEFLMAGADPLVKDKKGYDAQWYIQLKITPPVMKTFFNNFFKRRDQIFKSVNENNIQAMRYIAHKKPWVLEIKDYKTGNTPLHVAILQHTEKMNMIPMIQEMLKIEPELLVKTYHMKNKQGFTPMMLAPNKPAVLRALMGSEKTWNDMMEKSKKPMLQTNP